MALGVAPQLANGAYPDDRREWTAPGMIINSFGLVAAAKAVSLKQRE
jgi:hypothetical protein